MKDANGTLIGVQLVYCDNGQETRVWVDIKKIGAISWTNEEVKAKGKDQGGKDRIPTTKGPDSCTEAHADAEENVCWWNGTQWVCGTA